METLEMPYILPLSFWFLWPVKFSTQAIIPSKSDSFFVLSGKILYTGYNSFQK